MDDRQTPRVVDYRCAPDSRERPRQNLFALVSLLIWAVAFGSAVIVLAGARILGIGMTNVQILAFSFFLFVSFLSGVVAGFLGILPGLERRRFAVLGILLNSLLLVPAFFLVLILRAGPSLGISL